MMTRNRIGLAFGVVAASLLVAGCGTESPLPVETPAVEPDVQASETPLEEPTAAPTAEAATAQATATPVDIQEERPVLQSAGTGTPNADVTFVRAVRGSDGTWSFQVTVSHPDTGWEDYADGWDVVTPDGTVLKPDPNSPFTRLLLHPHETEQPFTRGQSGISVPEGVTQVTVRAHDLVDGFGGQEVVVDLSVASGENFEVEG